MCGRSLLVQVTMNMINIGSQEKKALCSPKQKWFVCFDLCFVGLDVRAMNLGVGMQTFCLMLVWCALVYIFVQFIYSHDRYGVVEDDL